MGRENKKIGITKMPISEKEDEIRFLQDEQIYLSPFGVKELYSAEYLKWMNDTEVTKTLGRFDYLMPVSRQKLIDYYNNLDKDNTIFLAIYHLSDNPAFKWRRRKFVGTLKIYDIDKLAKRASLGILIGDRSNWGKGFATHAIRVATHYIFDVLGFRKITAGYLAGNTGMEHAFLKNGYKKEAIFREHHFFSGKFVDHVFVSKFRSKL